MKKRLLAIALLLQVSMTFVNAQNRVLTNGVWDNWFMQFGFDMTLQNPYGYNFSHVFPNGKTFGLDGAIGKWFTPEIGVRGKLNWENGLGIFRNDHANWVAPFYEPGVNMDKGGYLAAYGELHFNVLNLLGTYDANRRWDLSVFPRAGVVYNFGVSKGAPLLGGGFMGTYRLNRHWRLYADMALNMCASGFVGQEADADTGTGSNSNGFFDFNVGVQLDLGRHDFERPEEASHASSHSVMTNGLWDNWFAQVSLDMSLMNPYKCNFSEVFPKGKTFGMTASVGKWITPELALRGRVQWENGLVENKSVEWVPPVDDPRQNYHKHGFVVMSIEALFNAHNIISGYDEQRRWNCIPFVRAGLIRQLAISSGSPLLGAGIENQYRLNNRLSLFADVAYQVTTSESSAGMTGMGVGEGSNGFFDIDLGVTIDLGTNTFKKR